MIDLNPTILSAVVDRAMRDAVDHPRWIAAITRGVRELISNPFIERGDCHSLIIGSASGKAYASNGICQCTAFTYGQACWHRAAARIVRLHDQAVEAQEQCPGCCAGSAYADRCPAAQISADQAQRRADIEAKAARAQAELDECFA